MWQQSSQRWTTKTGPRQWFSGMHSNCTFTAPDVFWSPCKGPFPSTIHKEAIHHRGVGRNLTIEVDHIFRTRRPPPRGQQLLLHTNLCRVSQRPPNSATLPAAGISRSDSMEMNERGQKMGRILNPLCKVSRFRAPSLPACRGRTG